MPVCVLSWPWSAVRSRTRKKRSAFTSEPVGGRTGPGVVGKVSGPWREPFVELTRPTIIAIRDEAQRISPALPRPSTPRGRAPHVVCDWPRKLYQRSGIGIFVGLSLSHTSGRKGHGSISLNFLRARQWTLNNSSKLGSLMSDAVSFIASQSLLHANAGTWPRPSNGR